MSDDPRLPFDLGNILRPLAALKDRTSMFFVALFMGGAGGCGLLKKADVSPLIIDAAGTVAVLALLTAFGWEIFEIVRNRSAVPDGRSDQNDRGPDGPSPNRGERPALTDRSNDPSKMTEQTPANDMIENSKIKDIIQRQ